MPPHLTRRALQLLTRRFPLYSGQYRVSHARVARRLTGSDETLWTTLRDGSRILINVNDVIGRTIYYCADHDPKLSWICRRVLRPGDCCIDVGAHMGVISLQAARLVGPRGVVHAFEPQPALAPMLRASAERSGYAQLRVHQVALSDADGSLPLFVPAGGDTGVATFDAEFSGGREAVRVPVRDAGALLAEIAPPPIRLLKLDIEHHEEAFFRGALPFLARNTPDIILFESHDRGGPFWDRPALAPMLTMGFSFFQIPKSIAAPRPVPLRPPAPPHAGGWDFLAISAAADTPGLRRRLLIAGAPPHAVP